MHGKVVISVVSAGYADALVKKTRQAGAGGATILLGKGETHSAFIRALGLGETEKEIVITLLEDKDVESVCQAILAFKESKRLYCGESYLIDVDQVLRHISSPLSQDTTVQTTKRRNTMSSPHTLITVIVNKGNATEVMDAARKAGATGGTVMHGRGTGKEEDVKFFGVQLVPEKEILLVLVGSGQTGEVLEAIRTVPSLAQPGSGIAFCIDVERFMVMGGKFKLPKN
jgi:nitrogen regulatory protein PII